MVNFGPLAAEIGLPVWGTPAHFNGFRILAALLHNTCDDAAAAACYLLSLLRVTYLLSPPRTARAQSAVSELPVC